MTEQWSKWEPLQGLSNKYYVDSISEVMEDLEIILSDAIDGKKKLRIHAGFFRSYKRTKIIYESRFFSNLDKQYGINFCEDWTFFKAVNSSYLQLISEESCTISDYEKVIQFSIFATNMVVDIITTNEPKVEWVETNQTPETKEDTKS